MIFAIIAIGIPVLLFVYKKSWFLHLHIHNILGCLYDLKPRNVEEFDVPENVRDRNAKEPLQLKSYINDKQNVHPKVLYFKDGFAGHKYWMCYSPFPWYIDYYENPCIAFSEDGYSWINIKNNPIDNPHGNGYDSDPHLVYCEDTQTLECWYRHVGKYGNPPVEEVIHRRISKDGIHWSNDEVLIENYSGSYARILSPSILWDGKGYQIWSVNKDNGFKIEFHYLKLNGVLEKIREFDLNYTFEGSKTKYKPWHIDVIKENNIYTMLVMCKEEKGTGPRRWDLFMTTSEDNIHYAQPQLVLHGTESGWDNNIYRASIVNVEGKYRIYYSALNNKGKHGLGIVEL